jgi:hypothetical protein
VSRVDSLQSFQERNKVRRESLQGCDLGCEDRVAAGLRCFQKEESGQAGGLVLVADIRMPRRRDRVVALLVVEARGLVTIDEVQVWITFRMTRRWVNVQATEVAAFI